MTLLERFESKYFPEPNSGCWLWLAHVDKGGYGIIRSGGKKGRLLKAHRVAYELYKGPIPKGFDLDHLCRVRGCVNPDHLEPVTKQENILRSPIAIAAIWAKRDRCSKGHLFTADNIKKSDLGRRRCLICSREYARHLRRKRECNR